MKKILFVSLSFLLFSVIPSFAQNTQQKANEINAAGKTAAQSQSATDARATQNAVWDGSAKSSGTTSDANAGQIDTIGGNAEDSRTQDTPSTFDKPESEDITPWMTELYAMMGLIGGAFTLMLIISFLIQGACSRNSPGTAKVATVMAGIATAMCAAALALAIVLMVKYKQTSLGMAWAIASVLAMTVCLTAAFTGVNAYKNAETDTYSSMAANFAAIGCLLSCVVIGGGISYACITTFSQTDKIMKEYCPAHPDYNGCDKYLDKE